MCPSHPLVISLDNWVYILDFLVKYISIPYHVKFAVLVESGGDNEGGDAAGGEGEIRVDYGSLLVVSGGQGGIKARPVDPQEQGS